MKLQTASLLSPRRLPIRAGSFGVIAAGMLLLSAQLAGCGTPSDPGPPTADLIIHGAPVWSAGLESRADAVAVRGDRILSVGSTETVLRLRGPDTRVVELDGDPFDVAPARLKDLRVTHTILGGEIVYQRR